MYSAFPFEFFSCRHAAANVPLCFVAFQYKAYLLEQVRIDSAEPFREIFVHSRFTDTEYRRCSPNCGVVFNHINAKLLCALFDLIMQVPSLTRCMLASFI